MRSRGALLAILGLGLAMVQATAVSGQVATVAGRVLDALSGHPVSSARVVLRTGDSTVAWSWTTDSTGRFAAHVDRGRYELAITAIGYRPMHRGNITVTSGDTVDATTSMEPLGTWLNPIVVSVSRREEGGQNAPATVSTIDSATIEEQTQVTPIERVRDAPGVDVATTGIIQDHVVTRGFNGVFSGALLVLTDHRFDFVPSLRVNATSLIPATASDIDRMEIVLGPAAALYGPNAAAGVLQILTKSPFDSPGTMMSVTGLWRGSNQLGAGGPGEALSLRHAETVGSTFGYKITADYLTGSDWRDRDSVELSSRAAALAQSGDANAVLIGRRDESVSRWNVGAQATFRPGPATEMLAAAGRTMAGSVIELTGIGAAQVRDWSVDYYQASLRRGHVFANAFANVDNAGQTYMLRTGLPVVDHSRMFVGQLQYASDLGARQTFTYGVDAQRTDPRTDSTTDGRNENDDAITEVGGYVQSETHLMPSLDLVTAARIDRNDRLPSAVFSPRAALVFRAADEHTFRLTYNRAFETPTAEDFFLDTPVGTLGALPFNVRALGVPPAGGFPFRRDCGGASGLCMRSPFASSPGAALPIDATRFWSEVVFLAKEQGWGDLSGVPAPSPADVQSVLRVLNVSDQVHPRFDAVNAADVQDVPPLRSMVTNTIEAGYKGTLHENLHLVVDAYYEWRRDFIGPPVVLTPNVFLDQQALSSYLSRYMPAADAQLLATRIGGVPGSSDATGIPLGTVAPEGRLGGSPDVLLTFRNFGAIHRVGSDVAAQWMASDRVTVTGAYSWTNKLLFDKSEVGGFTDIALNAPRDRVSLALQLRDAARGLSAYVRGRYTGGFPMNSGVFIGSVAPSTLADAGVAYRLPRQPDVVLALNATNVFDTLHREFVGAPQIGRLVSLRSEYTLR